MRDHPRTRGEKCIAFPRLAFAIGSPPHTRGKVVNGSGAEIPGGITPAHAGKSGRIKRPPHIRTDHPRTRGEKRRTRRPDRRQGGSPPHTRGKGQRLKHNPVMLRITPAHAGKSGHSFEYNFVEWDHPRTRGEKQARTRPEPHRAGSPPHTRGKDSLAQMAKTKGGITPAHAGKSTTADICDNHGLGSPPHTRGKGRLFWSLCQSQRITPAHAGKRVFPCSIDRANWDHPRTRGEKPGRVQRLCGIAGSPPHTRGKAFL